CGTCKPSVLYYRNVGGPNDTPRNILSICRYSEEQMKFKQFVAAALLVALGWNAPASAEDMLVSAASSLTNAFAEVAVQFQQAHPGTKVLLSFAGSDTLMTHIANGMPSDVFASADQVAMDKAVKA